MNKIKNIFKFKNIALFTIGTGITGAGVFYILQKEITNFFTFSQNFELYKTTENERDPTTPNLVEYGYQALHETIKILEKNEYFKNDEVKYEMMKKNLGEFDTENFKLLNTNFISITKNELYLFPKIT
jgi:hypothetical protein